MKDCAPQRARSQAAVLSSPFDLQNVPDKSVRIATATLGAVAVILLAKIVI